MKPPQQAVSFFETVFFIQLIWRADLREIYPFAGDPDGFSDR
jgi:hypothetical protein